MNLNGVMNLNGAVKQALALKAQLAAAQSQHTNRDEIILDLYQQLARVAQRMVDSGNLSDYQPELMSPMDRISLKMAECWVETKGKDAEAVIKVFENGIDELMRERNARR